MISWRNKPVRVRARLVPRFFWTTASIDVFLEDKCILRTGGQFKFTGSHSASFTDGRSEHQADLTWVERAVTAFLISFGLTEPRLVIQKSRLKIGPWAISRFLFLFSS